MLSLNSLKRDRRTDHRATRVRTAVGWGPKGWLVPVWRPHSITAEGPRASAAQAAISVGCRSRRWSAFGLRMDLVMTKSRRRDWSVSSLCRGITLVVVMLAVSSACELEELDDAYGPGAHDGTQHPQVVRIDRDSGGTQGVGTGFLIGPRLVVSAAHVQHSSSGSWASPGEMTFQVTRAGDVDIDSDAIWGAAAFDSPRLFEIE